MGSFADIVPNIDTLREREGVLLKRYLDAELTDKATGLFVRSSRAQVQRDLVRAQDIDVTDSVDLGRLDTVATDYANEVQHALTLWQLHLLMLNARPMTEANVRMAKEYKSEYDAEREHFASYVKSISLSGAASTVATRWL